MRSNVGTVGKTHCVCVTLELTFWWCQAGRYLADLLQDEHAGIAAAAEAGLDAAASAGEPWASQVP